MSLLDVQLWWQTWMTVDALMMEPVDAPRMTCRAKPHIFQSVAVNKVSRLSTLTTVRRCGPRSSKVDDGVMLLELCSSRISPCCSLATLLSMNMQNCPDGEIRHNFHPKCTSYVPSNLTAFTHAIAKAYARGPKFQLRHATGFVV